MYKGLAAVAALGLALVAPVQADSMAWVGCGVSKRAYMEELAAAFKAQSGHEILLTGGGSIKGIRSVSSGENAIGGTCRHPLFKKDGEVRDDEANAKFTQVAWDALVAIVHPENTVANLTSDQLKGIFMGSIKNWQEVGGKDAPIVVLERESKESGVGHMFRVLLFGNANTDFDIAQAGGTSSESIEDLVAKNPNSIAIDGVSSARRQGVKLVALDGVEPSKENIGAGRYTLFRPLYLVTDINLPNALADKFVAFALSPAGQAVISKAGTVNMTEGGALNPLWESKQKALDIRIQ